MGPQPPQQQPVAAGVPPQVSAVTSQVPANPIVPQQGASAQQG